MVSAWEEFVENIAWTLGGMAVGLVIGVLLMVVVYGRKRR